MINNNNKLKSNGLYFGKNMNNNINNRNNNNKALEKIMTKQKSEYLKDLTNNLIDLNEKDNFIFNNNKYKKHSNYIPRFNSKEDINKNKKRPISSIVQRKIEKSNIFIIIIYFFQENITKLKSFGNIF